MPAQVHCAQQFPHHRLKSLELEVDDDTLLPRQPQPEPLGHVRIGHSDRRRNKKIAPGRALHLSELGGESFQIGA